MFLVRSSNFDESYEWTAPYDRRRAEAAIERLARTIALTQSLNLSQNPTMWGAIPATPNRLCAWCPYFRRGAPADHTGCPGDVAADERREQKITDGLIIPQ